MANLNDLLQLADEHLDGFRLEKSSSKTSRSDRRISDSKTGQRETSDGDYRARTGNGPWIRANTLEEALELMLIRRYGNDWFKEKLDEIRLRKMFLAKHLQECR